MKKTWFFWLFLLAASVASFAADPANNQIFIEGYAGDPEQFDFFMNNFVMEAESLRFTVAEKKEEAGYTFKFDVVPNVIVYDDGTSEWPAPGEKEWVIQIAFTRNEDDVELVSFGFEFTDLMEMNMFNHTLFLNATADISPYGDGGFAVVPEDHGWRNKWLYLRASLDMPVTFYSVQKQDGPDGLKDGTSYTGTYDNPTNRVLVDNTVIWAPGITLGIEVQPLNFLSLELKAQFGLERLNNKDFCFPAAGFDVKWLPKFWGNVMLEIYGSVSFPLLFLFDTEEDSFLLKYFNTSGIFDHPGSGQRPSPLFTPFKSLGLGGGVQIGLRGGKTGAFFIDVSYMYYLGDIGIINLTNPPVIYYNRHVVGLGLGYKFGFLDRK